MNKYLKTRVIESIKKLVLLIAFVIIAGACSQEKADKLAEFEKLKKERDEINTKISKLEQELEASGQIKLDKLKTVSVIEIAPSIFKSFLEVQGHVDGDENVSATSKTIGVVTSVIASEGTMVKKGQVLAELDASVLKQTLVEVESSYDFVLDVYKRQKALWDEKIGSEIQYLQAKNNKENMEKRIATLKEQIAMSSIVSPITGRIEEVSIKVGQSMAPGMPAFRVVSFSSVKIISDISEAYSAKLKVGNEVLIYFPDFQYETNAKLSFVSKYINPTNRSFRVECNLKPGKDFDYRANMIAVLKVNDYLNPSVVSIPENLIQRNGKIDFVYVAQTEGKKTLVKTKAVVKGRIYNGLAEILSGLEQGEKLIVLGSNNVKEGDIVNIAK